MNRTREELLAEMRAQERGARRKHVCRVSRDHRPMEPKVTALGLTQWGCPDCGSTQPHLRPIRLVR
jgi:hypothetical protein